jgi:hypothetical protein
MYLSCGESPQQRCVPLEMWFNQWFRPRQPIAALFYPPNQVDAIEQYSQGLPHAPFPHISLALEGS